MYDRRCREYGQELGLELTSLELIQENKYCTIYRARIPDGPCIVKKYKEGDPNLVRIEAEALAFYHRLTQGNPELIDSGEPLLREETRLLCIGFVEGERFSDFLYKARKDQALRERSARFMKTLGKVLGTIYERTQQPDRETSPFIFEYFDYCSTRMKQLPLVGPLMFARLPSEARELADAFRSAHVTPSFVHGDFVFKNMHVKDERIGLIDFANANPLSHPLNDIYNLRFALANMLLPRSFKENLLTSFFDGLESITFPEVVHRFYYEYHRRRWLMLKLSSRNPGDLAQGIRGLMSFATPFTAEVMTV
jgi:hypothetical protein